MGRVDRLSSKYDSSFCDRCGSHDDPVYAAEVQIVNDVLFKGTTTHAFRAVLCKKCAEGLVDAIKKNGAWYGEPETLTVEVSAKEE